MPLGRLSTVLRKNMNWPRTGSRPNFCRVRFVIALVVATCVQVAAAPSQGATDDSSPAVLVRKAVANEIAASQDTSVKHMFRARKQSPHGSQTSLYVETLE